MRIIGGNFKGKKILDPQDKETRPLKDLTKESIFNILKHSNKFSINIENSIILDLFSGVGSFGLECLSRGAKYVTFVENYSGVLPILKKNLSNLETDGNYQVIDENILNKNLPTGTISKTIYNIAEKIRYETYKTEPCIGFKILDLDQQQEFLDIKNLRVKLSGCKKLQKTYSLIFLTLVSGSLMKISRQSMKSVPLKGSPPIPTHRVCPSPTYG